MPVSFESFPDVESFSTVAKYGGRRFDRPIPYRGKIKLHGTNASVRVSAGEVAAQSRNQLLTEKDNNFGFGRWVPQHAEFFKRVAALTRYQDVTVFGEWCGPGVMKGTAVSQLKDKIFAVFAVFLGTGDLAAVVSEPAEIARLLESHPPGLHVLPWHGEEFEVTYGDARRANQQEVAQRLSAVVSDIEPCDPWVKATFGVEGVAEGLVYYPDAGRPITKVDFASLVFKAKGEKHAEVKTKEVVQVDPEVAASVEAFAAMTVTPARAEKGVAAVGGAELKNTGAFLKWMAQDVLKESKAELEASGLTWDQVQKAVGARARELFLELARAL